MADETHTEMKVKLLELELLIKAHEEFAAGVWEFLQVPEIRAAVKPRYRPVFAALESLAAEYRNGFTDEDWDESYRRLIYEAQRSRCRRS